MMAMVFGVALRGLHPPYGVCGLVGRLGSLVALGGE